MKALMIMLLCSILVLSACAPELPPEPDAPSPIDGSVDVPQKSDVTGLAVADQRDGITWSTTNNVGLATNTHTYTAVGAAASFNFAPADDAIYHTAYYAIEGDTSWTPIPNLGGTSLGGNWKKDAASGSTPSFSTADFGLVNTGDSSEVYIATYTCTKNAFDWNCHGNAGGGLWQIDSVVVDLSLSCADQGRCEESGVCYDVGQENGDGTMICRASPLGFTLKTCTEQGFICTDTNGDCFNTDEYSATDNANCQADGTWFDLPGEPPTVG